MGDAEGHSPSTTIPGECPTAIEIGNAGWTILHTSAVAYPYAPTPTQQEAMRQWILSWSHVYACSWCAFHMRQYVAANPPTVADKNSVTRYVCELHNEVNRRLGKEEYDCDPVVQLKRWHPGYPDHLADEPLIEEKLAKAAAERKQKAIDRQRLEEAEKARVAALGLATPARHTAVGWRAWVGGAESPARGSAEEDTLSGHEKAPRPMATAPTKGSAAVRAPPTTGDGAAGVGAAGTPSDKPSDMSPGLMNSLLTRIKGCKVFCPDDVK